MYLHKVRLRNYRRYIDFEVDFGANFNVIVGSNGSGKTSLLAGITELLSGVLLGAGWGHQAPLWNGKVARRERVKVEGRTRFEPRFPVVLEGHATAYGFEHVWSVSLSPSDTAGQINAGAWTLANALKAQLNAFPLGDPLPVVAYYPANRRWAEGDTNALNAITKTESRGDAYASWANAPGDVQNLHLWLVSKYLARMQAANDQGIGFDQIKDDDFAFAVSALVGVVHGASNLRFDIAEHSLMVEWSDGRVTPFANLSDGQRSAIFMVCDIARRMCLLNPQLGLDVLVKTPGVILIDELDMHLHPGWQRMMVLGMKKAFPAVQFIVASHSPQVLSELAPEEIIVLEGDSSARPQASYGMDATRVLEIIMDAPARPVEVQVLLDGIFESLERNELDVARRGIAELRAIAPGITELGRAEALLQRREALGK